MKKTDLTPARQKLLVPATGYPGAYALIPPPAPSRLELSGLHDELLRAGRALELLREMSSRLPNPDLITRTADRREAVCSSQIEGTRSSVDDLLTYEATGSDEGLPPDVHVTRNYVVALEHGLHKVRAQGVDTLNSELVRSLHCRLMDGVDYMGVPGEFRLKQNWIGGHTIYQARFVPPPPDNVSACMEDLAWWLQQIPAESDQTELSITMRMAIAHAQFETIHPFIDGNGRVGRILLPLMLAAEGYPPVYLAGYLKNNQREYYDTLAGVQLKEKWVDWIRFFSVGVEVAAQESMTLAFALEKIMGKWAEQVAALGLRSDAVLHRFPALLVGAPVLSVQLAQNMLGVSFPAASSALAKLEEMGILFRPTQQKRNRLFIAREVIDVLNRPPSG